MYYHIVFIKVSPKTDQKVVYHQSLLNKQLAFDTEAKLLHEQPTFAQSKLLSTDSASFASVKVAHPEFKEYQEINDWDTFVNA